MTEQPSNLRQILANDRASETYRKESASLYAAPLAPVSDTSPAAKHIAEKLEQEADEITCYASTMAEYRPNRAAALMREAAKIIRLNVLMPPAGPSGGNKLTNREEGYLDRLRERCEILRARVKDGAQRQNYVIEWERELKAIEWAITKAGSSDLLREAYQLFTVEDYDIGTDEWAWVEKTRAVLNPPPATTRGTYTTDETPFPTGTKP